MEFVKTGEKDDMIRLSDGKNSAWFEFIESAAVNGKEYAALLQQGDDSPLILQIGDISEDGKERYFSVDDDAEFEKACSALEKAMEDM